MKNDNYFDNVTLGSEGVCNPRLDAKIKHFEYQEHGLQTRLEPCG